MLNPLDSATTAQVPPHVLQPGAAQLAARHAWVVAAFGLAGLGFVGSLMALLLL